jgi:cell division protein FtsQ
VINRSRVVRKHGWWPPRVLVRRLWAGRALSGQLRSWRPRLGEWGTPALDAAWARRLRLGVLAALCGTSLAVGVWYGVPWCVRAITSHPYFALTTIEIEGNRRLDRREVLQWAGVSEGGSVWDAAPGTVRLRLLSHPWIQLAQVQREFPNRLMIRVQERRPVAIVLADGPRYVDRRGHVLGPLNDDDSRNFPIISGLDGAALAAFTDIGMHRALQVLRWCERLSSVDALSEIHVDRHRGVTVFPRHTRAAVVLGWGNWREKLLRSARVFAAWEGQTDRLATVDLSFHDLVVLKLREEHRPTAGRSSKRGTRV